MILKQQIRLALSNDFASFLLDNKMMSFFIAFLITNKNKYQVRANLCDEEYFINLFDKHFDKSESVSDKFEHFKQK